MQERQRLEIRHDQIPRGCHEELGTERITWINRAKDGNLWEAIAVVPGERWRVQAGNETGWGGGKAPGSIPEED